MAEDKAVAIENGAEGLSKSFKIGAACLVIAAVAATVGIVVYVNLNQENEDDSLNSVGPLEIVGPFNADANCTIDPADDSCVAIAKIGEFSSSRRLGQRELQSVNTSRVQFSCLNGSNACDLSTNCNSDYFKLSGAFIISDERGPSERNHQAFSDCGFVRLMENGVDQTYNFDYTCGCADKATYLGQTISSSEDNCGLLRLGIDMFTTNLAIATDERETINGQEYGYLRQDDITFFDELKEAIELTGANGPKFYEYGYKFPIPNSNNFYGCLVTYYVTFGIE